MVTVILLLILGAQLACVALLWEQRAGKAGEGEQKEIAGKPPDERLTAQILREWLNGGDSE